MKIRIKTYNGELPSYLTMGKVYEVWQSSDMWSQGIRDDNLQSRVLPLKVNSGLLNNCHHLNGGSWEVVSE